MLMSMLAYYRKTCLHLERGQDSKSEDKSLDISTIMFA